MIHLDPIDTHNFWDVVSLKVTEEQEGLVTSNAVSIAQAKVFEELIPRAIYQDDTLVGFIMHCIDRDDDEYWLYRLMIDEEQQRQGYAREAMQLLIDEIKTDQKRKRIFLGVERRGEAAVGLYQSLGFRFNGQIFGKEHIMVLEWD
jgi:diamine N-acetyltransferase